MAKLIELIGRKGGMTRGEFRDYYEQHHAPLAISHFGHLFATYTRNYIDPPLEGRAASPYDVVTEIVFHDDAAMAEMCAMAAADPALSATIAADEERFMDRASTSMMLSSNHACSAVGTPPLSRTAGLPRAGEDVAP